MSEETTTRLKELLSRGNYVSVEQVKEGERLAARRHQAGLSGSLLQALKDSGHLTRRQVRALVAELNAPAPAAPAAQPPPTAAPPPAGATHVLIQTSGDEAGRQVYLGQAPVLIGRAPNCDLCLADGKVSARHTAISPEGDGLVIEDLDSTNGTLLNQRAIKRETLKDGDLVTIKPFTFACRSLAPAAAAAAPAAPPARPASLPLTILAPPEMAQKLSLCATRVTLGRDPENTIVLDRPEVAPRHATIEAGAGGFHLTGEAPILVNGRKLPPEGIPLAQGDLIEIAPFKLCLGDQPSQPPAETTVAGPKKPRWKARGLKSKAGAAAERPAVPWWRHLLVPAICLVVIAITFLVVRYIKQAQDSEQRPTPTARPSP